MPAKSAAQKRLMDAAAHNPEFAKKVGIPSKVAKEFSGASKGMTFKRGGEMKEESKAMMKKEVAFMKKKGAPKSMIKHEEEEMVGKAKRMPSSKRMGNLGMSSGGLAPGHKTANGVAKRGLTKGKEVKMAAGGMAKKKYC